MAFSFNTFWVLSVFCNETCIKYYPGALHQASILRIELKFWKWNGSQENKTRKKQITNPPKLKQQQKTQNKQNHQNKKKTNQPNKNPTQSKPNPKHKTK